MTRVVHGLVDDNDLVVGRMVVGGRRQISRFVGGEHSIMIECEWWCLWMGEGEGRGRGWDNILFYARICMAALDWKYAFVDEQSYQFFEIIPK